jgi:hypothetical protein
LTTIFDRYLSRRRRVVYSGDAWLAPGMRPVTTEEVLDRYSTTAMFDRYFRPLFDHYF